MLTSYVGVILLKQFHEQYDTHEKQRQELSNAEKLFDLPITTYSDLIEVDKDLKIITRVYDLYEAQRVYSNIWCVVAICLLLSVSSDIIAVATSGC